MDNRHLQEENLILEPLLPKIQDRRALLPFWIKIFVWPFMIMGTFALLTIVPNLLGLGLRTSIYGLESNGSILSPLGLFITAIFVFKGIVAFCLWMRTDWAVRLAIIDAWIGIGICTIVMFVFPFLRQNPGGININFRLELLLLIPYLIKMRSIKNAWEQA